MSSKVLLAEDDQSVRRMVARVLETAGYEVLLAGSVEEALAYLGAGTPDLLLIDWELQHQNGCNACELVRRSNPIVPAIVLTTWPNQDAQASQYGLDALIEKPLDLGLLLEMIQELLAEPEPRRDERRGRKALLEVNRAA